MKKHELIKQLQAILPAESVLFEREDLKPFECDGLSAYREVPMVVVLPETEEQVRGILLACRRENVPVVARGAGTGLSGGALPLTDGVLLSLTKFKRILSLDPVARIARVQPGVRNLAISEAAAPHGLYYAPDPSSQIACSIGGNVAENAGGVHCLKYGLTVHNVLKVRAYTMDGELLELGSEALDSAGYDLLALFTGSEGMLGVITEVTVKLLPKPELARVVMAAFGSVTEACVAVGEIIAAGIIPAGLEMMDRLMTEAVEDFVHAGYPLEAEAILLCESDGTPEEVAEEIAQDGGDILALRRHLVAHVGRTRRTGCGYGPGARPPSPRRAASRPITTAWTAPSRGANSRVYCAASGSCRSNTVCASAMCSMPATATCIR